MRLFRVAIQVGDIEAATAFYGTLLKTPGSRVSAGRHYFQVGEVIIACVDTSGEGGKPPVPNANDVYLATNDLDGDYARAQQLQPPILMDITVQPWGERSFYLNDPWGNPVCIVDESTLFLTDRYLDIESHAPVR